MASSLAKNETPEKCQALVLRMSVVNNWALRVLIGNANINQETEQEVSSWRALAARLWCRAGVGQDLLSPHRWQPPQRCEIQPGLALTDLTVLQNNSSSKLFVRKGPLLKHHRKLQRFLLSVVQTSWSAPTAVALDVLLSRTWAPSALWL